MIKLISLLVLIGCSQAMVQLNDFYPSGPTVGDISMSNVTSNLDDGSSPQIALTQKFKYYSQSYSSLWVNINGGVSFYGPISDYTPSCQASKNMISPFWADIDLSDRTRGLIYYRQTTDLSVLEKALKDVKTAFPTSYPGLTGFKWTFVATWLNVPFYSATTCRTSTKSNTFQMVLATDGVLSFAIFNYNKLEWTTGTASGSQECSGLGGSPARAGFDGGEGIMTTLPGSCTADILNVVSRTLSSSITPGKYVFQVDNSAIVAPGSTPLPTITNPIVQTNPTLPPTIQPEVTTLSEEQEEFQLHQKRLKRTLETMKPTLMSDCMKIVDRIALQKQCFMLLERLSNLEFETVEKATKLNELTIIDNELSVLQTDIAKLEADIRGFFNL